MNDEVQVPAPLPKLDPGQVICPVCWQPAVPHYDDRGTKLDHFGRFSCRVKDQRIESGDAETAYVVLP